MIAYHNNTRGKTMEQEDFSKMDEATLVIAHNKMAESELGKQLGAKTIQRFESREAGIERCEQIASSIRAYQQGMAEENNREKGDKTMTDKPKKSAKKASKKSAKKASKKVAVKAAANGVDNRSKFAQAFEARQGTNRQKLIDALASNFRKPVTVNSLLKSVYGSQNVENKTALAMSMRGALATIKSKRLPYRIEKTKDEKTKEISFGLHPKS